MEEQKEEAGEDSQQEILTPPEKMNTERDTESELYSAKKEWEKTPRREQKVGKRQMISMITRRRTPQERSQVFKSQSLGQRWIATGQRKQKRPPSFQCRRRAERIRTSISCQQEERSRRIHS